MEYEWWREIRKMIEIMIGKELNEELCFWEKKEEVYESEGKGWKI